MKTHSVTRRLALAAALALSAPLVPAAPPPAPASAQAVMPATLDLRTAIDLALRNNYAIRSAREQIRQQDGLIVEVQAQRIPNASVSSAYTRQDKSLVQSFGPGTPLPADDNWNISLTVRQNLFAGGGIDASVKSQRLARDAALLSLQAAINTALAQVRVNFYGVLLAREQIRVQEENLRLLREELKTAQSRYHAGVGTNFDLLTAQVAVANGQPPLIQARNNYRLAIENLRQSLGLAARSLDLNSAGPEIVGQLAYTPESYDLATVIGSARANRPELQSLAKTASSQEQAVRVQQSNYWPDLALVGGYGWRSSTYSTGWGSSLNGWQLGLQSNWAVFDGRATEGKVAVARSALNQARLQLGSTELAVEVEVRSAFSSYEEANELVQASGQTVDQAEEAVRLARARYDAGTATQLDVLNAEVALTQARSNRVQSLYSYNVAVAQLRQAAGMSDTFLTSN